MSKEIDNVGKRGPLSTPEMEYIKKNIELQSVEEIAAAIGKTVHTVRKFVYRKNLVSKETIANVPDAHRRIKIKDKLRSREYWSEIKKQFTPEEIVVFEDYFVSLYIQFDEDCLPSEELQIKKFITLEILKDRMLKQDYLNAKEIEKLRVFLDAEYALPPELKNSDNVRTFSNTIEKLQTNQLTFLEEYRAITQEQKFVEKSLKMSRDDRIKNIQDATQNWTSILKLLSEDNSVRDKVGKHIELMRIAKDQSKKTLSDFHTFIDNSLDRPLLNHETVENDENNKNIIINPRITDK